MKLPPIQKEIFNRIVAAEKVTVTQLCHNFYVGEKFVGENSVKSQLAAMIERGIVKKQSEVAARAKNGKVYWRDVVSLTDNPALLVEVLE